MRRRCQLFAKQQTDTTLRCIIYARTVCRRVCCSLWVWTNLSLPDTKDQTTSLPAHDVTQVCDVVLADTWRVFIVRN